MEQLSAHSSLDYAFAYNNAKFSDRTLQLEIMPDSPVSKTDSTDYAADGDLTRSRKYQDSNGTGKRNGVHPDLNFILRKLRVCFQHENPSSKDIPATQVKSISISSVVLAAKSPFFCKLFSNGMLESNEQHITLHIQESEEVAFMDMLKYMYTNTLSTATQSALLDVLIVAHKYEVASCMKYCSELSSKIPMTCESALLYLDLPSTISMNDTVRLLKYAAKNFLVVHFQEISEYEEEMLTLPIVIIEAVLSSDDLQVNSEDCIYDFVMKWARRHYTNLDERREILTTRLLHLIRFPFMSCHKLEQGLTCTDINLELASNLIFPALSFKIPHQELPCAPLERVYKYRPVKLIRFNSPQEVCKVYLDLKHDGCARLLPNDQIHSEIFELSGIKFQLVACHDISEISEVHYFSLFLCRLENIPIGAEFEISGRKKPCGKFVFKRKLDVLFTGESAYGCYLFDVPWDTFIAEDSPYFIN